MNHVSISSLLSAWDQGLSQSPARRAVTLLAATYPALSEETILNFSIGERDRLLLDLREAMFGSSLTSLAQCPQCSERLEMTIDIADIRLNRNARADGALKLELPECSIGFRLPNSQDIMLVEKRSGLASARKLLLERCLLSIESDGQPKALGDLTDEALSQIEAAMSEADPQADIQLALSCPACQNHWLSAFDIASFLGSEINAWAKRILNEVHLLAKAYGWSEADILALTPTRRRFYLALVSGASI